MEERLNKLEEKVTNLEYFYKEIRTEQRFLESDIKKISKTIMEIVELWQKTTPK